MLILVVDSATPAVTAALVDVAEAQPRLLAQRRTVDARAHGELLAPHVAAVLDEGRAAPADLTAVVAGLGPGPFTGLRVGLATAAALCHTLGLPGYGVCSLDALGHGCPGTVLVATDARRREVYWGVYTDGVRRAGPSVSTPDSVAAGAARHAPGYAVGEGAERYAAQLGLPVRAEPRYPVPLALAELAAERVRTGAPGEPLTPLYLRRPDAVAPAARKPVLR